MKDDASRDAVVVGAGPNGLSAAIVLAQEGWSVRLLEAEEEIGGGARSAELTLPGFLHDVCSAIHPMAVASPFFRSIPLERYGLEWSHPEFPLAHPMDDGSAAVLARSVEETAEGLGPDGPAYRRLFGPLVRRSEPIIADVLSPLRLPSHPFAMARFGIPALRSAAGLARRFQRPHARALLGGIGAHAVRPLDRLPTGAVALVLGLLGHSVGWPVAKGGSRRITDALAEHLRSLGGEITTGHRVGSLAELRADVIILDVTPRQLARIGAERLPAAYRRSLLRYRYGPGVFKVDWALDGPIPWKATECSRAGTVHLGGTFEEIAASEEAVSRGEHPERPYVLVGQQSLFDPGRAPAGKHTGWAYCHVPNGSDVDVTARIEAQMERFAPGFRDLIRARSVMGPADLERHNENCVGGDIAAGSQTLWQTFARPTPSPVPYATPLPHVYLGSASTPPGPGVHGMCGALAARAALRRSRG